MKKRKGGGLVVKNKPVAKMSQGVGIDPLSFSQSLTHDDHGHGKLSRDDIIEFKKSGREDKSVKVTEERSDKEK